MNIQTQKIQVRLAYQHICCGRASAHVRSNYCVFTSFCVYVITTYICTYVHGLAKYSVYSMQVFLTDIYVSEHFSPVN